MSIHLLGEIAITGFQQQSSGEESPWVLKINKQDNFAVVRLHWGNKLEATHIAFANLEEFKRMVASL